MNLDFIANNKARYEFEPRDYQIIFNFSINTLLI